MTETIFVTFCGAAVFVAAAGVTWLLVEEVRRRD